MCFFSKQNTVFGPFRVHLSRPPPPLLPLHFLSDVVVRVGSDSPSQSADINQSQFSSPVVD